MAFDTTYANGHYWNGGGTELHQKDNTVQYWGDGDDLSQKWDGTNFVILPVADDTGAINIGDGTTDIDLKVFLSATTKYALFDVGGALLTLEDVDLHLGDNDRVEWGDAVGGDVYALFNGTNLTILPATDDTGAIYVGDGTTDIDFRVTLGAAGDYVEADVGNKALEVVGDVRIDLSSATVAAANTDGGVIKGGTSGSPITEDTAGMKFLSFYFDDGATSGEAIGEYLRLYVTGEGGEGIAGRFFCSVTDVAGTNARGVHNSLSFGTSGNITGLGVANDATLHVPNSAMAAGGTYAAVQAGINSDGASSDPSAVTALSFFRVSNQGDDTGIAAVDDKAFLFDFSGGTADAGNMISGVGSEPTWASKTHKIRCKLPDGSTCYLIAVID